MQNKGFVKAIAILLTLICLFYFSFSFVTNHYERKAEAMGPVAGKAYLDSMMNEKVYLNWKTLKECQSLQIGLGLDLKGGMNVILEVSVPDVVKNLAGDNAKAPAFQKAVDQAHEGYKKGDGDFVELFVKDYAEANGAGKLGALFAARLKEKNITFNSSDAQVQKALEEEVDAAVANSNEVVRSRIDRFGVAQPNIQILRGKGQIGQIMVEMPGIKEPERVRKLLQGSANLEFWETYTLDKINAALQSINEIGTASDSTQHQKQSGKPLFRMLSQQNTNPQGCIVGYAAPKDTAAIDKIIYSEAAKSKLPADLVLHWSVKPEMGQAFALYALRSNGGQPALQGDVIADAKDDFDQYHRPIVSMTMTNDGAREWANITKKNLHQPVAIVLDGYVYSAPEIQNEINGGSSQISGHFTTDDTRDLANVLKSGKMPAPTNIVQEETVGPSLGSASIQAGLYSCIVAFILLMIFMCCYYGFIPGMVANAALILNFFYTFGILVSFQAALTMSGIAGLVLSLGMAVDANVLIYERTKEELRSGKNIKSALAAGYGNAFSAIFDSNLTSIITAIILYNFGTGPIRGFALTLGIGICASFFTAVWISRMIYERQMNHERWLGLTFSTPLTRNFLVNAHFRLMKNAPKAMIVFGLIVLVCIGSLATRGLSKGIDFTGGRNFVIEFEDRAITPEKVDAAVERVIKAKDPNATISAIEVVTAQKRAVRLTTNYMIDSDAADADEVVEKTVYEALKQGKLITADYKTFKDRENRSGGSIVSAQKVGPAVAADMAKGAIISVILSLIAIFVYILARFRNVAFSIGSVLALTVDTLIIVGMYSICWGWMPFSLEVDQTFIGAVLTAIGYSINDKVVVFDRIRENLGLYPKRETERLFNDSLNETLARTIMTSATTLLVLLCIFFLGGDSIRSFAFAMILGVVFGTLSSIFLAAPIAFRTLGKKRIIEAATAKA
ncbi:protein translocase subunit SecD [uncultured Alloprevotella sp.]|uniref:protein translocase subunit SecD n=1 Tax=uncultured Alloprevotella sp. TaxID=1283315 RepID=UPI002616A73F|nr:protein translocase subunit SecD [uncultured Alloprevotella sp.]